MIIEVVCTANIAIVLKRKNFLRKYLQLRAIFLHKMTFWVNFTPPKALNLLNILLRDDKY
jgi:hypothetical protein